MLADDPADPSVDMMWVSGAVEYDALARQVGEWWPTTEPLGTIGTYQTAVDPYPPTTTAYDLRDRPTRVALPSGEDNSDPHVTTTSYGFGGGSDGLPSGVLVTTTSDPIRSDDPAAGKAQVVYSDVRDNVLARVEAPSGAPALRTRYAYDPLGQRVRTTDSAGSVTTSTYDGLGRRLSTRTPDAGLREQRWDPAGNLVAEVTPTLRAAGQQIAYDYDVDRLTTIDYPSGTPDVTYRYGGAGAAGNGAGRVVALEDGAREQSLAYDALGNVAVEVTTMKAHNLNPDTRASLTYRTAFEHDSFGRLAELTYPDGEVLRHEHDSGGLLSGLQGTKACTSLGTLAAAVDAAATTITVTEVAASAPPVPFTVRIGREQLQVTARTATSTPGVFTYTVRRGVDGTAEVPTAASHAAGAKVTSDSPVTCDYRYLDRQEYDQFLVRRLRGTGNGVVSSYGYDWLGRLEVLSTDTRERQVQNLTWGYDKAGNVVSTSNDVPATVPSLYVGPSSQEYAYDPYYRLSSATGTADVGQGRVRTFTQAMAYDANGNVTSKTQTDVITQSGKNAKPLVQTPTTYTFGMAFAGRGPHQLTANGSRSYSYDANGNLTGWVDSRTKEKRVVSWDAEDRITRIADGKDATDYRYDADGRRAVERGPDGETLFVNRWYTVRNGAVPWKHVWAGDDRLATKRSFDRELEHQQYYLSKDLQGSTNVVTDATGKVFEHWEYFPGGEPWIREDSNVHRTPYLYAGGYRDDVRGLLHLGERWYEPREGVFYSPDAALHRDPRAAVADPALLPAYTYAESSPLRLVDPGGAMPSAAGIALQASGIATSARALAAGAVTAVGDWARETSSRTKESIRRYAASDDAKALQVFSDRWSAKPLVAIELGKGGDGWGLQSVKLSPFGFVEKQVVGGSADLDDGGDAPPRPGTGAPAVQPGAGTAAATTGPAAADTTSTASAVDAGSTGGPVSGSVSSRSDLSRSSSDVGRASGGSVGASVGAADGPPVSSGP